MAIGSSSGDLKEQGGLPDSGIAADENERTGHDTTSQYPVEFWEE